MGRFNAQEVAYLSEHILGRLATTGTSGKPHVVPVGYHFDPEREVIKIGGASWKGVDRSVSTSVTSRSTRRRHWWSTTWRTGRPGSRAGS